MIAATAAVAVATGSPAATTRAVRTDDVELVRLCHRFLEAQAHHISLDKRMEAEMPFNEAHPDADTALALYEAHQHEADDAGEAAGSMAQQVFATPARTLDGLAAKLDVLLAVYGDGQGIDSEAYGWDAGVLGYQSVDRPWLALVVDEARALGGGI